MHFITSSNSGQSVSAVVYRCAGGISGTSLPGGGEGSKNDKPGEKTPGSDGDISAAGKARSSGRQRGSRHRSSPALKSGQR